jgi:hypothetical protein
MRSHSSVYFQTPLGPRPDVCNQCTLVTKLLANRGGTTLRSPTWHAGQQTAPSCISVQERSAKAFDAFLLTFIRTFEDWKPPDAPSEGTDSNASSEDVARTPLYGCDIGHPTRVVVSFVQELKNVTRVITECKVLLNSAKHKFVVCKTLF